MPYLFFPVYDAERGILVFFSDSHRFRELLSKGDTEGCDAEYFSVRLRHPPEKRGIRYFVDCPDYDELNHDVHDLRELYPQDEEDRKLVVRDIVRLLDEAEG